MLASLGAPKSHPRCLACVHQNGPRNRGHRGGCHPDGGEDAAPRVGVVAQHLSGGTKNSTGHPQVCTQQATSDADASFLWPIFRQLEAGPRAAAGAGRTALVGWESLHVLLLM